MCQTVQATPSTADMKSPPAKGGLKSADVKIDVLKPGSGAEDANALAEAGPVEAVSLRKLYRYATSGDLALLAAGTCAVVVSGANQPLQLVVFGGLLDSFNDESTSSVKNRILFFAAMYAALGVQQMITNSLQSAAYAKVAARQARRIRELYFQSLMNKPMAFVDTEGGGQLASSVLEATSVMAVGMGDDLAKLLQQLLAFVFGLGTALFYSWRLALVSAAVVPFLGFVVAIANSAYNKQTQDSDSQTANAAAVALETLESIRTGKRRHHAWRASPAQAISPRPVGPLRRNSTV